MPNTLHRIALCLGILILGIGITVRSASLSTYFTSTDDIGVAYTHRSDTGIQDRDIFTHQIGHPLYNTLPYKTMRALRAIHADKALLPALESIHKFTLVSRNWTYPPLSTALSGLLISGKSSYKDILFWGRLPSLLASIAMLMLMAYLLYIRFRPTIVPALPALGALALSWPEILGAKQMHAISVNALALSCTLLLIYRLPKYGYSHRFILAIATLCYASYQLTFFLPAIAISIIHYLKTEKQTSWTTILKLGTAHTALLTALIAPVIWLLSRSLGRDLGWKTGPGQDYLFQLPNSGIIDSLQYIILFFLENTVTVTTTLLSYTYTTAPSVIIWGLIGLLISILGLFALVNSSESTSKRLALFICVGLATHIILCLKQQLAFSPSRHSTILLPILTLLLAEGFASLYRYWPGKRIWGATAYIILSLGLITGFSRTAPQILAERQDPITEEKIKKILIDHNVDHLIAQDAVFNFDLMPSLDHLPLTHIEPHVGQTAGDPINAQHTATTFLYLSTFSPLSDDILTFIPDQGSGLNRDTVKHTPLINKGTRVGTEFSPDMPHAYNNMFLSIITIKER